MMVNFGNSIRITNSGVKYIGRGKYQGDMSKIDKITYGQPCNVFINGTDVFILNSNPHIEWCLAEQGYDFEEYNG